jgi:nucleoside-diphosphate-sugar epimerase
MIWSGSDVLPHVDIVVHLAARVHILRDSATDPLTEFRKVNALATANLARKAAQSGVNRFVFLSSIGVNGNATPAERPFRDQDAPAPHNSYSISKLEAEQALQSLSANSSMETVVIRAPIVYGPGNPANALRLFQAVHKRSIASSFPGTGPGLSSPAYALAMS